MVKCKVVRKYTTVQETSLLTFTWYGLLLTPMDMECVNHQWVLYKCSYFVCCKHDLFNQLQIMRNGNCMSMCVCVCVCACVHACVCVCIRMCVCEHTWGQRTQHQPVPKGDICLPTLTVTQELHIDGVAWCCIASRATALQWDVIYEQRNAASTTRYCNHLGGPQPSQHISMGKSLHW